MPFIERVSVSRRKTDLSTGIRIWSSDDFDLQPGLKLAIWPRSSIAQDTGVTRSAPSPTEFTLGHNVGSREDVDAVMAQAKQAGAVIVKEAHDTFWGGYSGYFQDPDKHLWEIVWNPNLPVD